MQCISLRLCFIGLVAPSFFRIANIGFHDNAGGFGLNLCCARGQLRYILTEFLGPFVKDFRTPGTCVVLLLPLVVTLLSKDGFESVFFSNLCIKYNFEKSVTIGNRLQPCH